MHPGTVDGQAAFAAQGVIDGEQQRTSRREHTCHEHGQTHVEKIETPGSIAEEAMKARPMPVGDIATREDDVGDEAMAMREGPPGTDLREGPEGRLGKNGDEVGYQIEEGLRKLHESASLPGDLEFFWYTQDAKKRPGSRHEFLPRTSPAESAKLELSAQATDHFVALPRERRDAAWGDHLHGLAQQSEWLGSVERG